MCKTRWERNIWPFDWTSRDLILPTMMIPSDHQVICDISYCATVKQFLNRRRVYIPDCTAGIHYYQKEVSCWSFVVVHKICIDVSDLCNEIAIIWLLETLHLTIWLYVAITEWFVQIWDNIEALEISFIRIWACVDKLVETQGYGIQYGQNCTLSLFWGQCCMEKLYEEFVRRIIPEFVQIMIRNQLVSFFLMVVTLNVLDGFQRFIRNERAWRHKNR